MLLEKKFGLTTNVMATKMIPTLAPQTINPALNLEQFGTLMEVSLLNAYTLLLYFYAYKYFFISNEHDKKHVRFSSAQ